MIKYNYFWCSDPFLKEHLGVSLSINICPFDAGDKLSPMGGEKLKKIALFALSPSRIRHSFFYNMCLFFLFLFPISGVVRVTPGLLGRETIDSLPHEMDFVMFGTNIWHWRTRTISSQDQKDTRLPYGCDQLNMVLLIVSAQPPCPSVPPEASHSSVVVGEGCTDK